MWKVTVTVEKKKFIFYVDDYEATLKVMAPLMMNPESILLEWVELRHE